MKKLYTFALASLVALTAAAVRPVPATQLQAVKMPNRTIEVNTDNLKPSTKFEAAMLNKPMSRAEASIDDYAGEYYWTYFSLMDVDDEDQPLEGSSSVEFEIVDASTGEISISGISNGFTIQAFINLEEGTMTLPNNQYLTTIKQGKVYFYFETLDNDGKLAGYEGTSLTGTIEDGYISFPKEVIWAFGNNDFGWYDLTFYNEFEKGLTWYTIAEGSFLENIMYPLVNGKDNTTPIKATVQKCVEYDDVYRLLDPMNASYKSLDINSTSPYMIFDASNPEDVYIGLTDSGLQSKTLGNLLYFSASFLYAMYEAPTPFDERITLKKDGNNYELYAPGATVNEDETVEGGSLYIFASAANDGQGSFSLCSESPTWLKFTYDPASLDNVVVDEDANAPVEYFNLQGIRVANPENGIFIRRQGNNTTKVRF